MQSPMPIAVADAQLAQAMRDYMAAHDAAMSTPPIDDKLAASTILTSLRYVEQHGLTDKGRRELRLAIAAAKTIMGEDAELAYRTQAQHNYAGFTRNG